MPKVSNKKDFKSRLSELKKKEKLKNIEVERKGEEVKGEITKKETTNKTSKKLKREEKRKKFLESE